MGRPLTARLPRELAHNFGRYLGIFLLIAASIAFVAGFLAAASSIKVLIADMPERYQVEDGRFTTPFQLDGDVVEQVERDEDVTVFENFSKEVPLRATNGRGDAEAGEPFAATARVYPNRETFDLAAYHEGTAPQADDEVALDSTFCAHHDLSVGDTVQLGGRDFRVSGICTLADYTSLFEDNGDFLFNTVSFTVAQVTEGAYGQLPGGQTFTYSYFADDESRTATTADEATLAKDIAKSLSDQGIAVTDIVPASSNKAIFYAGDDVEGDMLMWEVMLGLVMVIMAFVFVVLTGATIEDQSAVIGTLLASGYRKRELIAHYLALPALVGIVAGAVGNVLGYTLLSEPMKNLYYNSYSLPPYEAVFNWDVFLVTTVVPVGLLVGITLAGLMVKLRATPLQFLRHETTRKSRRAGRALPERLRFATRFRLRVLLSNLSSFVTLFCGLAFATLLMLFGLCLLPVIDGYAQDMASDLVAEHQYTLKAPVEIDVTDDERDAEAAAQELATTDPDVLEAMDQLELLDLVRRAQGAPLNDVAVANTKSNSARAVAQAEKVAVGALQTEVPLSGSQEPVTVYGIAPDSAYWKDVDVADGRVVAGRGLLEKCGLSMGDEVAFTDPTTDEVYHLTIDDETGSLANTNIYLGISQFNQLFGNEPGWFNGYVSDEPLAFDDLYLASDMTPDSMAKISEQMHDSMGSITGLLLAMAAIIYVVLIYLLTKTVLDRCALSISYLKVFGYRDREVDKLYLRSLTETVALSLLACQPVVVALLLALVRAVFLEYDGNFPVHIPLELCVETFAIGLVCYLVVALLHVAKIRRVPLALALKTQE